jgi:hypothetical protein
MPDVTGERSRQAGANTRSCFIGADRFDFRDESISVARHRLDGVAANDLAQYRDLNLQVVFFDTTPGQTRSNISSFSISSPACSTSSTRRSKARGAIGLDDTVDNQAALVRFENDATELETLRV